MEILNEHTKGDKFLRYRTGQRPLVGDVIESDCDGRVSIKSIEGIRFKTGLGELSAEGIIASSLIRRGGKLRYNCGTPVSISDRVKYKGSRCIVKHLYHSPEVRVEYNSSSIQGNVFIGDLELITSCTSILKPLPEKSSFLLELQQLINKHSKENDSNTPDYILAQYLEDCLRSYAKAIKSRDDRNTKCKSND
jgi:hypothetical protein